MTKLWLDLETTGLTPTEDFILEVAWAIEDADIDHRAIQPPINSGWYERMNQYVLDMHTGTGLLAEIDAHKTVSLDDVEEMILADLDPITDTIYLAGASVHFDLAFITHWMPRLRERLSHRVYDTSTLKAFFEGIDFETVALNPMQHRAAYDVYETRTVDSYLKHHYRSIEARAHFNE